MLTETILENITSLGPPELESLFDEYQAQNGAYRKRGFPAYLYEHKHITAAEYKKIQIRERVALTHAANVTNVTGRGKHTPDAGEVKITGTYIDHEDYIVLDSIDQGAMGEILIARDNKLNRTVAYKKIHPHVANIPSYLGRFYLEAQITAQLQHPNIVPVYALMNSGAAAGYAMKLIDGVTLKDHIHETREQYARHGQPDEQHSLNARLDHFLKVCDALHYAHCKGVIHRDLKPVNIMIGFYNDVYVMDWGIAKTIEVDKDALDDRTVAVRCDEADDRDRTRIGQVLGTPAYMSPEQADGELEILDHRADLYSLGLVLFELITLQRAISGKNSDEIMRKAKRGLIDSQPPCDGGSDKTEQLLAVVKKATCYDPDDRYATVEEFADDIRRAIRGEAIKARPEPFKYKVMRMISHHQKAAMNVVVAYSLLASLALALALWAMLQIQAQKAQQLKEQTLSFFVNAASDKAQLIDAKFQRYEVILKGLAEGAASLLNHGAEDKGRYYTHETIADPTLGPRDYSYSGIYGFPVSMDYHSYKLAPGIKEAEVRPLLRRLNPLRRSFKALMLKSRDSDDITANDDARVQALITREGLPLVWMFVGLEQGVMANYPGRTGYPVAYDPRYRPWYRGSLGNKDVRWLQPYIDVGGRGLVLPATSPLFNNRDELIGVAGVELTLDHIRENMLPMADIAGLEETYLLNAKAEIVVASSAESPAFGVNMLVNTSEELEPFPVDHVVDRILGEESGDYTYQVEGREKVVVYKRMNFSGWYYAAISDVEEMMATP